MSLRHNPTLRSAARRLPIISSYERRIAEMTADIDRLASELQAFHDVLWAMPGHFYSPIPPVAELRERDAQIFDRDPTDVPGLDLRLAAQWALLDGLEPLTADLSFAEDEAEAARQGARFWTDNSAYGAGDATFLTLLLRYLRPKRLIELGCGYSSACTLDARERYLDGLDITFVDPYSELLNALVRDEDRATVTILSVGTQDVPLELLGTLESGDVLFIDSTHVSRTGSDVTRIFQEILPALAPGVVVHLHDIFHGFEYPRSWVYEGRSWNEAYMLRAFLQFNAAFEILLWPDLLLATDRDQMVRRFPAMAENGGGACWLRKVA